MMMSLHGRLVHTVLLHEQVDQELSQMDETEEVRVTFPAKRLKLNTVGVGKVIYWVPTT